MADGNLAIGGINNVTLIDENHGVNDFGLFRIKDVQNVARMKRTFRTDFPQCPGIWPASDPRGISAFWNCTILSGVYRSAAGLGDGQNPLPETPHIPEFPEPDQRHSQAVSRQKKQQYPGEHEFFHAEMLLLTSAEIGIPATHVAGKNSEKRGRSFYVNFLLSHREKRQ